MRKHAFVTLAHSEAQTVSIRRIEGDVILGMAENQFNDFRDAGLVREATAAEVAKAQGKRAPAASKISKPKASRAPKKAAAAPKTEPAVPPAAVTDPNPETDESNVS